MAMVGVGSRSRSCAVAALGSCSVLGILCAAVALLRWDAARNARQPLLLAATAVARAAGRQRRRDGAEGRPARLGAAAATTSSPSCWDRLPPTWPRALVVTQRRVPDAGARVGPAVTVTYYDYDRGGNLVQITPEDGANATAPEEGGDDATLWDLELNDGRSYYFTPSLGECRAADFPVGILRPDWLAGATPLGPSTSAWRRWEEGRRGGGNATAEDRPVCGWTQADFVDYYADAATGEPDSWYFHAMRASFRVLDYRPNAVIDPSLLVPPDYCF